MNTVKSLILSAAVAFGGVCAASAATVLDLDFGITAFGAAAGTDDSWTYNSGTSTLSGTEGLGFLVYGETSQTNFTTNGGSKHITHLTLTANVLNSANAPLNGFTFLLQDGQEDTATGVFNWVDFIGGKTVTVALTDISPSFDYNNIVGFNLVSGGSNAPLNVTFTDIRGQSFNEVVVPEPSTYAAVAGLVVLGAVAYRKRRTA